MEPGTYDEAVRTFDHSALAALPAYPALRQALNDLANQAPDGTKLADLLSAVRDMAATAPYADMCSSCARRGPDTEYKMCWPHAAEREDGYIRGTYRCGRGHTWQCGYAVAIAGMF